MLQRPLTRPLEVWSRTRTTTLWKADRGCKGDVSIRQCLLVHATLDQHVITTNSTIVLDDKYTYKDDKVVAYYNTSTDRTGPAKSVHGGLALALSDMFVGTATLNYMPILGSQLHTEGVTAMRYQRIKESLGPGDTWMSSLADDEVCRTYWPDPTDASKWPGLSQLPS